MTSRSLLLLFLLSAWLPGQGGDDGVKKEGAEAAAEEGEEKKAPRTVSDALEDGIAALLRLQQADGTWLGPQSVHYDGMTPFAVYTLMKCGLSLEHPAIRLGRAAMTRPEPERTYDYGCWLMAYEVIGEALTEKERERAEDFANALVRGCGNGRRAVGAGWGYPNNHSGKDFKWTDLSNTQYALLGLRAASRLGIKAGSTGFWVRVTRELLDSQFSYGGWGYRLKQKPSASMTVAGMTCLLICREMLGEKGPPNLTRKIELGLKGGERWLAKNWSVKKAINFSVKSKESPRWYYYYMYGIERVASFWGRSKLAGHDWHAEGSKELVERQNDEGGWFSDGIDSDTCFALLFLRRGSRSSGLGPRARREAAAADDAEVVVGMDGSNPVRAWVRTISPKLRQRLEKGAKLHRLTWMIDGGEVHALESPSLAALQGAGAGFERRLERNGVHKIKALVEVQDSATAASTLIESNVLELVVDDVPEAWHLEGIADARNDLFGEVARAVASSAWGNGRNAGKAIDGEGGSSWIPAKDDLDPWIEVSRTGGIQANVIKVVSAQEHGLAKSAFARPRDVEVRVNRGSPFVVRMVDDTHRKQWIKLPRRQPVRTVRLRILSTWRGGTHANIAGFKSIELFDLPAAALARHEKAERGDLTLLAPSRKKGAVWRYSIKKPPSDWATPGFRDLGWKKGKSGFGGSRGKLAPARTAWKSSDIWLRTTFEVPRAGVGRVTVSVNHDDDVKIWINGVMAATAAGYSASGYTHLVISEAAQKTIHPGRNVIAVHCHNVGGAQFIDAAVTAAPLEGN